MSGKMKQYFTFSIKALRLPIIFIILFFGIGVWLYITTGTIFYIINFGYIGTALAIGFFLNGTLNKKYSGWGRRISALLVGIYMLGYLGLIEGENMQIEGFFFYLLMGVFAGATIHYLVAKIGGTVLFGRGWCGNACWTAMVLDFLPWKRNKKGRYRKWGLLRYAHFIIVVGIIIFVWFTIYDKNSLLSRYTEFTWLITGNIIYYAIGIILAAILKDNRAYCKYVCPIPVFMKIGSRFSILKMSISPEKCTDCGLCEKACLMDIKLLEYKNEGKRILSTECILCNTCSNVCPTKAISFTTKFDCSFKEKLNWKE